MATQPKKPARETAKPRSKATPRKPAVTPTPARSPMRLVLWVTLLTILCDQALKYYVVHVLRLDRLRAIDVLPPWLNFRMAWNEGINFGLMSSNTDIMRWALIALALVVCIGIWLWLRRNRVTVMSRIAAGLLIGGALGNVIDRLVYGAVADFLNMSLPGWQNPYSFNLADIAIFAGMAWLIWQPPEKPAGTAPEKASDAPSKSG